MNNESKAISEEDNEPAITERKIYTQTNEPEVKSLHEKCMKGKLILQSDFQRHFVWDIKKSSRLIESALVDIPLPVIYLSEEQDGKEVVIDGQQRLTSFFSFIEGKFPSGQVFRLSGLKVYKDLNKKTYKELDENFQDKISHYPLRTITFKKDSNHDLKFEIFERLNNGAVTLNQQELRNCIYRGSYNELLKKLAQNEDFVSLVGHEPPRDRMRNVELVLRFAAFYHSTYLHYKPPMVRFFNNEMIQYRDIDGQKAEELTNAFKNTVDINNRLFGSHAFKRFTAGTSKNPNGDWESQVLNKSLYDILMYSFAKEDKNKVYQNLDSIREALICLMTEDQEFIQAIVAGTSNLREVTIRFDKWRMTLQSIIGIALKEPRCFSQKLKEQLFNSDPTCLICGQRIQDIDDSAVDHIDQYWLGGKTIPENARLTHRYCNLARPRHDVPERPTTLADLLKKGNKPSRKTSKSNNGSARNDNNFSHRKPVSFIFEGERFPVSHWNEILLSLCNILYEKYQSEFDIVLDMRGPKRQYFSKNTSGMDFPKQIENSNFYVETNWSAKDTMKFCNRIIERFGYDESDLQVDYE